LATELETFDLELLSGPNKLRDYSAESGMTHI